jgi:hypothetical protein
VSPVGYSSLIRQQKKGKKIEVFVVSIADIQKALAKLSTPVKERKDPREKLPK